MRHSGMRKPPTGEEPPCADLRGDDEPIRSASFRTGVNKRMTRYGTVGSASTHTPQGKSHTAGQARGLSRRVAAGYDGWIRGWSGQATEERWAPHVDAVSDHGLLLSPMGAATP